MIQIIQKHIVIVYALLGGLLILSLGFATKIFFPFKIMREGEIIIQIEKGQSLTSISRKLKNENIIDSPLLFHALVVLRGAENAIPAGYYLFSDGKKGSRISLNEIVRRLVKGDSGIKPIKLTVPEGSSIIDIAKKVNVEIPSISVTEFASSAKAYEGYLFPDTYFFTLDVTPEDIVTKMRSTFNQKVLKNTDFNTALASSGRSLADIVNMASILEGEVRTLEDRKIVADLLWRRIAIGMPLQVDATFSYINQKASAELTLDDLRIDSPYNTYRYKGLPPTPISNPGLEALFAAMQPTANKYVYFLNDKEGTSHFSVTYDQHLKFKNKYLR